MSDCCDLKCDREFSKINDSHFQHLGVIKIAISSSNLALYFRMRFPILVHCVLVLLLSLRVKQSCFFTYNFNFQVTKIASPNVHWHVTNAVFRFLCQDGTRQSKNWLDFSFLWESWNYVIFTPTFILLSGPEIEYFLPGFLNRATI